MNKVNPIAPRGHFQLIRSFLRSNVGRLLFVLLLSQEIFAASPVVTTSGGTTAFTEGTPVAIDPALTVTDSDSATLASATVSITGGFQSAEDILAFTATGSTGNIAVSSNTGGVLTLTSSDATATLADWRTALRAVTYSNSSDTPNTSNRTISFVVNDGTSNSSAATQTVSVTAVNDAPVITVPGARSVSEDASLTITGISFTDPDAASSTVQATLSAANGALTLTTTTGLTFSTLTFGNGGVASMTFTGTPANINSALSSIVYRGSQDFSGSDTLTVTVNDLGNTGSDGAQQQDTETVTITVSGVNDAPVITVPGAQSVNEDTNLTIGGISYADPDAGSGTEQAALSVQNGTIALSSTSGLTITSGANNTAAMTFTGTRANINSALNNLVYRGAQDYNGSDTLALTINDLGTSGSGGALQEQQTIAITVNAANDAPTLSDANVVLNAVNEDAGSPSDPVGTLVTSLVGIGTSLQNVQDVDTSPVTGIAVIGTDTSHGTWFYSTDNGVNWSALTGVAAGTARLLAADANTRVYFQPAAQFNGTVTSGLTFRAWDRTSGSNGGTADTTSNGGITAFSTSTDVVSITVNSINDAPAGANNTITINEDSTYSFTAADFGFTDTNDSPTNAFLAVTITTLPTAGTLNTNGVAVGTGASVPYSLIATGLQFTPAANGNGTTYATFTFQVQDDGGTASGGVDLDPSANTITFDVSAVNDVPSFTKGADQSILEDAGAQSVASWATAMSAGPSNESSQVLTFQASNNNNALFSVQPAISASGILTYTPAAHANGTATVTVAITDDGGISNSGVNMSASQTFTITVTAVDDVPSFTKGADQTVLEDSGSQTVSGWATGIGTGPSDESSQTVSFSVTNDNNSLFSTQPALAANGTLTFTPAVNANGSATVSVTAQDTGTTANGGANTSATQTFTINVTAVNDAPSFTKGADQSVSEDAGAQSVSAWATALSAGPSNESAQVLTFQVSNDNNALFSVQPAVSATGTLTYTPAANANGSATVTVAIADDGGTANSGVNTSAAQTFTIGVTASNDAPTVATGFSSITETVSFSTVGTTSWSVPAGVTSVEVLVVGGGGAGGGDVGGGGGGGQVVTNSSISVTSGQSVSITVGAGGVRGSVYSQYGLKGGDSTLTIGATTLTAVGGSGGAGRGTAYAGGVGFNGGGGSHDFAAATSFSGGNAGGASANTGSAANGNGGGGGSGGPGVAGTNSKAGDGGPGFASSISGTLTYYGGGGGGSFYSSSSSSVMGLGVHGGGHGGYNGVMGTDGTAGLGGGGGGGPSTTSSVNNGLGGSGVVILRYSAAGGFTVTEDVAGDVLFTGTPFADQDSGSLTVTLSISDGTITGNASAGITVGGTATARTFAGSVADLNTFFTTAGRITYLGASNNTTSRTLTTTVSDGNSSSSTSTPISFTAVNDAPTVTAPASFALTEDVSGNLLYTGTPFADVDHASLTVTLSVADGTITGNSGTGITVDGTATARTFAGTVSDLNTYFTTAGKITYLNAANNTTDRTLTTSVSDGSASNSAISTLALTAVNDAPALAGIEGTALSYTENQAPTAITSSLLVADLDSANLASATVSITGNYAGGQDLLVFSAQNGITGSYSAGTLTLSGTASLAQYQTALRSVAYTNTSDNPSTLTRTVTFAVQDDGGASTTSQTRAIAVTAANDAPTMAAGAAPKGTGGTITSGASQVTHTFTSGGTFVATQALTLQVVAVGGGGGGAGDAAGGGGGGGAAAKTISVNAGDSMAITVGTGGAGVTSGTGGNGGDTTIVVNGVTVVAGGGRGAQGGTAGAGGVASGGDINLTGGAGSNFNSHQDGFAGSSSGGIGSAGGGAGMNDAGTAFWEGGLGGDGLAGNGGRGAPQDPSSSPGQPGSNYGGGGGGGGNYSGTGGMGAPGVVTVSYAGTDNLSLSGLEDTTLNFTAANFTGAFGDPEGTALASITVVTLPATGILKLSGTPVTTSQVIPAANLGSLTYEPAANETGAKTFTVTASDGALSSATATVTINLAPVGDAPSNTVPGTQTIVEDTTLAFTGPNLISVVDLDGSATSTQLKVSHGALTVSSSGGATISAGANGSAGLTLAGTPTQINAALATLYYQPGANYNGSDALTVMTSNNLYGSLGVGAEYGPVAGFSYSADPILGDSRTPDKAFDGTTTDSHSAGFSASESNPFYFKITAPTPIIVSTYYLSGRGLNDHKPSSWTFEGSNDDSTWTVLDTQSGIDLIAGAIVTSAMNSFPVTGSASYRYYRLAITATTGSYVVIGEMALVGQSVQADFDTIPLTITPVNDAPTIATGSGGADRLFQKSTARIVSLTGSAVIRGLASDGTYLYVNHNGSEIRTYGFDGSLVSSHAVSNLPGGGNQIVYAAGSIFARNGDNLYRVSTSTWSSTLVTVDAAKPLLSSAGWMTGNLFNAADGKLGVMGATSGGQFTVRTYTVASDGLTLTWSQDYTVNDDWAPDEHGLASDGTYLYRNGYNQGYKSYDLQAGTVAYDGRGWSMSDPDAGGAISNTTFMTRDPGTGRYIVGDFDSSQVLISAAPFTSGQLPAITEDANPAGASLNSLISTGFSDAADAVAGGSSANTFAGIAIINYSVDAAKGQWQYRAAGGTTWNNLVAVSSSTTATTLKATDELRFLPAFQASGPAPALTVALIESPASVATAATVDATTRGAATSFSASTVALSLTVTPVNNAPSFTKGTDQTILEDAGAQSVNGWATALSAGPSDESGQTLTFHASNDNNSLFSVQPTVSSGGTLTYTPAANANGSATVTVTLTDSGGTSNGGVNTSAAQTFTITVTPENDAPAFSGSSSQLVYETVTPTRSGNNIIYSVDNSAALAGTTFGRVRYRMETTASGVLRYADVSFDAWSGLTVADLRVPTPNTPRITQRSVDNLEVDSNYPGVVNASGQTGRLEIWDGDYSPTASAALGGDSNTYDFDDTPSPGGYGSFQVHNLSSSPKQTVLAWNQHASATPDVGFGNRPTADPDWTFSGSSGLGITNWKLQIYIVSAGVPSTFTLSEDGGGNLLFGGMPFSDGDGATLTVTLAVADGTITGNAGTGITVGGTATARTFTGTAADLNAYFTTAGKIAYQGPANNTASRTLTTTVSDGSLSSSTTSSIIFTSVNDAPSFTKGPDQTDLENSGARSVTAWASGLSAGPANESSQTLTFELTHNNPGLFAVAPALSPSGNLSYTLAANASGTALVAVTLKDNGGTANGGSDASPTQTFTITVTPVNDPPTLSTLSPVSITEDAAPLTVSLAGIAAGPAGENQVLTVTATSSAPSIVTVAAPTYTSPNSTGTLTLTPVANGFGTATITVVVTDDNAYGAGTALSAIRSFQVTVAGINDPPTLSAIADQSTPEDTATPAIVFAVADPDQAAGALLVQGTSSNTSLVPNDHILFNGTGANRTLIVLPAPNATGTTTITVIVSDGQASDATSSRSFTLTVQPVNDPPVNTAPAFITATEDAPFVFEGAHSLSVGDADAGNDLLRLSLAVGHGKLTFSTTTGLTFVDATANGQASLAVTGPITALNLALANLAYLPDLNFHGSDALTFASDDLGRTGTGGPRNDLDVIAISVTAVNDAPGVIHPLADVTVAEDAPLHSINLIDVFGDADRITDGQGLNFTVANHSAPSLASARIQDSLLTLDFAPNAFGTATLVVRAADGFGGTVEDAFTVTVQEVNDPPQIQGQTFSAGENAPADSVVGIVLASDPDSASLTYAITTPDAPFRIDPVSGQLNVHGALDFETHPVWGLTVEVRDSGTPARSASALIQIQVTDANDAPVIATQQFTVEENRANVTLGKVAATDVDAGLNGQINFRLAAGDAEDRFSLDPATGLLTLTAPLDYEAGAAHAIALTVEVTDRGAPPRSSATIVTIQIQDVFEPPTLGVLTEPVRLMEDAGTVTIDLATIEPGDLSTDTSRVEANSNAPELLQVSVVPRDPTTGIWKLQLTPTLNRHGAATVTTIVRAGTGPSEISTRRSFAVEIVPVLDGAPRIIGSTQIAGAVSEPLVILPNSADGPEVTHFRVTEIQGGSLYLLDQTTPVRNGDFVAAAPASAGLKFRLSEGERGQGSFRVQASLDASTSGLGGIIAPVTLSGNAAPTAAAQSVTTSEDTAATVVLNASDADADPLTFRVVNGPAHGTLTGVPPTMVYSPARDFHGSDTITFVARDAIGDSAPATVQLTVTPVNDPPTLNPIPDRGAALGSPEQIVLLSGITSGATNEIQTLTATASVTPADFLDLLTVTPVSATGEAELKYRVSANAPANGAATVVVTVHDGAPDPATTSRTFHLSLTSRRLAIGQGQSMPGLPLEMPVVLHSPAGGENAVSFSVKFDARWLQFVGADLAAGAATARLVVNDLESTAGRIGLLIALPAGLGFEAGATALANLRFRVADEAPATNSPMDLVNGPVSLEMTTTTADPLFATFSSGQATILLGFEADVAPRPTGNTNGTVRITDWVQAGRFAAALDEVESASEFQRADSAPRFSNNGDPLWGDGRITLADWVQAGRYATDMDPVTPAGGPFRAIILQSGQPGSGQPALRSVALSSASLRQVKAGATSIALGATTFVPISIHCLGNENALSFSFGFDSACVRLTEIRLGQGATGGMLLVNRASEPLGKVGVALALPPGQAFASGPQVVIEIGLTPVTSARPTASELVFGDQPLRRELVDILANALPVTFTSGEVHVTQPVDPKPGLTLALRLDLAAGHSPGVVTLRLLGSQGQRCVIERSADLTRWTTVQELVIDTASQDVTVSEERNTLSQFYRARVNPQ